MSHRASTHDCMSADTAICVSRLTAADLFDALSRGDPLPPEKIDYLVDTVLAASDTISAAMTDAGLDALGFIVSAVFTELRSGHDPMFSAQGETA